MTASGIGLVFWVVAARYYSIESVGVASTILSAAGLVSTLAGLGMDQSLIRFFPSHDRSMIFGTTLKVTFLFSLLIGVVFLAGASIWMPDLLISTDYGVAFILVVCAMNIAYMTHTAFVGRRVAKFGWAQNLILGIRVILLVPLVAFASLGILNSIIISYAITLVISSYFLYQLEIKLGRINSGYLRESLWFSTGNYAANLLSNLPSLTLSLIVFSLMGDNMAAIYYMAFSVASIVFLIPTGFTTSLFVEGSHGEGLGKTIKKAVMITYAILVPLILIFFFFGEWILGIFGKVYSVEGLDILRLMVISSVFLSLCLIESTVLKIRGHIRGFIILGAINSISFFALSILLFYIYGEEGIGFGWILSFSLTSLVGALQIWKYNKKEKAAPHAQA